MQDLSSGSEGEEDGAGGVGADAWEDDFDAVGVAKCGRCGLKVSIYGDAIEQHTLECGAGDAVCQPCGDKDGCDAPGLLPRVTSEPDTCASSGREELDSSGFSASASNRDSLQQLDVDSYEDRDLTTGGWEDPDGFEGPGLDDWDLLDAIGVAKCGHCGLKLPLNDTVITKHLAECASEGRRSQDSETLNSARRTEVIRSLDAPAEDGAEGGGPTAVSDAVKPSSSKWRRSWRIGRLSGGSRESGRSRRSKAKGSREATDPGSEVIAAGG